MKGTGLGFFRWLVLFGGALALLTVGLFLGEAGQVMMNAASICLACMGLG